MKNAVHPADTDSNNSPPFKGLSGEQALLAAIVSENPHTAYRVRLRAKSLLLLDGGATVAEVSHSLSIAHRSLTELIHRFGTGGLCDALLGSHASHASRIWLTLSPGSSPHVRLQPARKLRKRVIDTATPSANSTSIAIATPLSPTGQACRCQTDLHQADLHHQGGPPQATPHA